MKFRFSKAVLVKVLAFTAVSAVFTVGLGVKIGNLRLFTDDYRLEAEFSDATGIFRGDAVKLAGVEVGRVMGAEIEEGKAIVSFVVDQSVRLPLDSTVAMRWRNVLGQRFLYLHPGRDDRVYRDGDRIPLSRTQNAGDIGEFLNNLAPILQAIDPEKANAFLDAVNTALAGNEAAVQQLLANGNNLDTDLAAQDEDIQTLIESSDIVVSTYAGQDRTIRELLAEFDSLSASLESMTDDVNALLENFPELQLQLDRLLKENRANIDADLRLLDTVSGTLAANRGRLEDTLCTLPAGLAGYFQTTSWGEWFNVNIIQFVFKDSRGNTIATASQLPSQQDPTAPPPYTRCAGSGAAGAGGAGAATGGSAQGPPGSSGSQGTRGDGEGAGGGAADRGGQAAGPGADAPPDGFETIDGLIRFVLGEDGRG